MECLEEFSLNIIWMQAAIEAETLQPSQVPLLYWAFASQGYCPVVAVLTALEARVKKCSPQMTTQVSRSHYILPSKVGEAA